MIINQYGESESSRLHDAHDGQFAGLAESEVVPVSWATERAPATDSAGQSGYGCDGGLAVTAGLSMRIGVLRR